MPANEELKQIITGCQKGKEASFAQLVDIYSGKCFGYFYRLTGNRDTSEELLSELFVRLVEKIGSYRGGNFNSWIFKVAANIFYDHLRKKQRQQEFIEEQIEQYQPETIDYGTGDDGRIDKVQKNLGKLDVETRQVITLRFYSGMSFAEIADFREEPIGTVLSRLHRGLKKLREMMEKNYGKQ